MGVGGLVGLVGQQLRCLMVGLCREAAMFDGWPVPGSCEACVAGTLWICRPWHLILAHAACIHSALKSPVLFLPADKPWQLIDDIVMHLADEQDDDTTRTVLLKYKQESQVGAAPWLPAVCSPRGQ